MNRRDRAREIVDAALLGHPGAAELATFVSLAVRVEPELLRAMRLEVLPRLGATAEADLWFSPLVRLRGPDGIALRLDVLEVLRADLKLRWQSDGERQLVERAWRVTQRIHRDTSPALVLEERVAWFALTGALGSAEAELDRAVKELEAGTRPGITGWYAQAWSRLPAEVRDTRAGWLLYQASGRPGPVRIRPAAVPDDLLSYDLSLALARVDDVRLGVHREGDLVQLGDFGASGAAALLVPDTDPRIVELSWPDEPARKAETIAVPSGETVRREIGTGRLQLRTARGILYELATQQVHRYLIAAGVADYAFRPPLPAIPGGIRNLAARFEQFGYELALPELNDDATGERFLGLLGSWLTDPSRQASDVVVLYWAGHSAILQDGPHYLFMNDSIEGDAESPSQPSGAVITAARLGRLLARRVPDRLLVILDTSYAAQGAEELHEASGDRELWTIGAVGAAEQAYDGAFVDAFLGALDEGNAPPSRRYLALDSLLDGVNRRLDVAGREAQHATLGERRISDEPPPFFPNPGYRPQSAGTDSSSLSPGDAQQFAWWADSLAADPERDQDFTGRSAALRDVVQFLSATSPSTLVVTGGPGSGKSALLGRLVTLADGGQPLTRAVRASDLPPDAVPAEGSIDLAISAARRSLEEIVSALAAAAGVSRFPDLATLFSAISLRSTPFVIVLDALDEAINPHEIALRLLQPLAEMPSVRLIVGTRRAQLRNMDPSAVVIDLDSTPYLSQADLSEAARRILLPDAYVQYPEAGLYATTPYVGQVGLAEAVANAIAEAASPSFLVARLAAQSLAARTTVVDPTDPAWRTTLPTTVGEAFDADVGARLDRAEEQQRVHDVLTPLAYAEGAGLPWEDIWAKVATALAERPIYNEDIRWMNRVAGDYVAEAIEAGRSVYRLSPPVIAEYLRQGQDETAAQRKITQVLTDMVPPLPGGGREWSVASPYTLKHLAAHAVAAGMLTELLEDPGFRRVANPQTLRAAQGHELTATTTYPAAGGRDDGARIVAVHGANQEFKGASGLLTEWLAAMEDGLRAAGYQLAVGGDLAMAFYGNLFRPGDKDDLEVPEDEILSGLKESLRARTLGSSRRQITQYLQDPEVRGTARGLVVAQIGPSTRVVVAHDLGSVVAYEALCDHPELNVETFITLGSPIGQPNVVFDRLEPAPRNGIGSWPGSVKRWINIADQDDGIAQPKQLAPLFDGPVLDIFVSTGGRPHSAARYLAATATGRAIADGLL